MGYYYTDRLEKSCLGRALLNVLALFYCYLGSIIIIVAIRGIVLFIFGNNYITERLGNNMELFGIVLTILGIFFLYLYAVIKDNRKKFKITEEENLLLSRYNFKKMSKSEKKLMARAIKLAPSLIFLKLKRMDFYAAKEVFMYKDSCLDGVSYENRELFKKAISSMEYTEKGETHTLYDWGTILTEERIQRYKERINFERNRFHKHVKRSDDAKQADLLNISYMNYRKYNSYYNGLKKVISKYGLNSNEVKKSIALTIERIGDLQEWKDFIDSKESMILHEPTERGRYATFYTNIISNTRNVCNVFYTSGSFYVVAYFDNITFEERDTFIHNDVIIYVYKYDFIPFVVFEFKRLRFAVPLSLKDYGGDFDNWISSSSSNVTIHLIESNSGKFVATRVLKIKNMLRLKNIIKIQRAFNKELMDISIRDCANKSLDEMVYNGFVLEEIKGDKNTIETSLF